MAFLATAIAIVYMLGVIISAAIISRALRTHPPAPPPPHGSPEARAGALWRLTHRK